MYVVSNAELLNLITAWSQLNVTGVFGTAHLFVNNFVPSPLMTPSDFTEATFPGYADESMSVSDWGAPFLTPANVAADVYPDIQFTSGAVVTPQTVYGWYVTRALTPAIVVAAELFPVPVIISGPNQAIVINPIIQLANLTGSWLKIPPGP